MVLYKIKDNLLGEIKSTDLDSEGKKEIDLEEWLVYNSNILGEDLLIIGRQVKVQDVGDGIDLLAIDREGNLVILELKRGRTPNDIDFQALKYASYVETWDDKEIESQFKAFQETTYGKRLYPNVDNFQALLDKFCNEDYSLNGKQRIIIVANEISEKIGSVLRWLDKNNIDVGAIEIKYYEDGDGIILHPNKILPIKKEKQFVIGGSKTKKEPWKTDGKDWHLNQRSNSIIRNKLIEGIAFIKEITSLEGPFYDQKFYISFKEEGLNKIGIWTQANQYWIWVKVGEEKAGNMNTQEMSESLNTEVKISHNDKVEVKIDKNYPLNEKLKEFILSQL